MIKPFMIPLFLCFLINALILYPISSTTTTYIFYYNYNMFLIYKSCISFAYKSIIPLPSARLAKVKVTKPTEHNQWASSNSGPYM